MYPSFLYFHVRRVILLNNTIGQYGKAVIIYSLYSGLQIYNTQRSLEFVYSKLQIQSGVVYNIIYLEISSTFARLKTKRSKVRFYSWISQLRVLIIFLILCGLFIFYSIQTKIPGLAANTGVIGVLGIVIWLFIRDELRTHEQLEKDRQGDEEKTSKGAK